MAEPTFVSLTVMDGGTDGTHSVSYDSGSETDPTLCVDIGIFDQSFTDPITVDTCTYNGVSLTQRKRAEHQYAGGGRTVITEQWTLDNPATGSNTLVVTLSEGGDSLFINAFVYSGANNSVGANTASTSGNISDHEYDITSTDAEGMNLQCVVAAATRSYTPGTGTTTRGTNPASNPEMWTASESASAGADTVGGALSSAVRSVSGIYELLPSAGAGPQTVTLNALTLAGSAEALVLTPGGVSISLSELTLAGSPESLSVTPGGVSVALGTLTLTGGPQALTVTPGAISVTLGTITLAGSVVALTVSGIAGVSVSLNTLTLAGSAPSASITPGGVSVGLNTLTLAGSGVSISVTPGGVSVTLGTITLTGGPESLSVTPGGVSIALDALTLAGSVPSATVTPGAVTISLDSLTLASSAEALNFAIGIIALLSKHRTMSLTSRTRTHALTSKKRTHALTSERRQ